RAESRHTLLKCGASKTFRASEWILVILSFFFTVLTFPVSVWLCIKIVSAFERAVFLRLGHMRKGQAEGPGMYFVLPCTDTVITVDMRTKSFYIPLQEILTKDPVTVDVDGVIYYRVQDAILAVTNVTNADSATLLLAETTLRNVLGTNNFSQIVSNREKIAQSIKVRARCLPPPRCPRISWAAAPILPNGTAIWCAAWG
uniref:Podocin n=1 Tax=Varanus komodoensis TaxID=61221 RepID=A0A8D2J6K0_VARKO